MDREPDFLRRLHEELSDARVWVDRALVLGFAALAGLSVVVLTVLADGAMDWFLAQRATRPWMALVWTPALSAAIVWAVRRWCPGAAGSGVPQVCAALDPRVEPAERGRFVSLRLSAAKVLAVSGGLLAGLSTGRQGPSVQVAAGVMLAARRWLSPRSGVNERELLVAGGAVGIAAAFNTPLGGIVFAIEELTRRIEQRNSGLMLAAIVVGGLVAVSVFGNFSYFGRVHVDVVAWWGLLLPGALVALGAGLFGGLLARLLIASSTGLPDRLSAWRRQYPVRFAAACGFVVAAIGLVSQGAAVGGGHHHTRELLAAGPGQEHVLLTYTGLKFVASWLSAWSGVPGGIFGPALSIGASWGADVAAITGSPHLPALIALGMAGFLAAVTQAPITAMIIVMEMTDGHAMVLSLMGCALVASLLSRLVSRPLYATLSERLVRELRGEPGQGTR
ncbi:chloride channel protein [Pseudorhodoferax sp.]|uniref:chloride channel protein n=1 Tax=Pseudorhodoferax sp. TaxID=1993553 RepID=UPI002DD61C4A|nr:chloride channel protein [Pseudorhodoferax sp.]